jgi:hypothetical protein
VTVAKVRRCRCSVRALLRRGERGKEAGRGAVKLGGWCSPFIRGRGLLGVEMTVGNCQRFKADTIDGRGGGVLMGIQEGESKRGSKGL